MEITLFGAGGKAGIRLARSLKSSRFEVRRVEVSSAGRGTLVADACNKAIEFAKPVLMRPWMKVFEPEEITARIKRITQPGHRQPTHGGRGGKR